MKKILLYIGSLCLLINNIFAQESFVSYAPQISSFALNPDNMGAIGNSVNLFTGDVNLPLNLVSMPGRNGLGTSVGIFYNSNVQNIVGTWNLEAPTGILGLGWSMPASQIIVDHKSTGARDDDDFYLVDGGSSNRLIRIGGSAEARTYSLKNYRFWKITYYPASEKWEIIKEDGLKYIYGDNISNRNTVQYLVKWGNWIGNSAVTTGQSRQASVWDISEVVNSYNESIKYSYTIVEETVEKTLNSGGLKYTKASYLEYITDQFNRQIKFIYSEKGAEEYQDPHIEKEEPDAYQERLETRYLSSIEVKNENSVNLFSIEFKYDDSYGTGNLKKRLLTEIIQKNKNGNSLPSLKFAYQKNASENNPGTLQKIIYPSGGEAAYTYTEKEITRAKRDLTISAPSGYVDPIYHISEDYVVVMWKKLVETSYYEGLVEIYQWDGEWVKSLENYVLNQKIQDQFGFRDNYAIKIEKDFFAILTDVIADGRNSQSIYIFSKDELKKNKWNVYNETTNRSPNTDPFLLSGRNFIAVKYHKDRKANMDIYLHDKNSWSPLYNHPYFSIIENPEVGENYKNAAVTAANNFLIMHDTRNANPDELRFCYFNELMELNGPKIVGMGLENYAENSYWHASNNLAIGMIKGFKERVYWWNDDYENIHHIDLRSFTDNIGVYITNSIIGFYDRPVNNNYFNLSSYCFDGANWREKNVFNTGNGNCMASFGTDYLVERVGESIDSDKSWYLHKYDPNNSIWNSDVLASSLNLPNTAGGLNYFSFGNKLYYRKFTGTWEPITSYVFPTFHSPGFMGFGINYFTYSYTSDNITCYDVAILKNGDVHSVDNVTGTIEQSHIGANILVTHNDDSSILYLHMVLNDKFSGSVIDYPVSQIDVNNGHGNQSYLKYGYNASTARIDPSGQIAQYNYVRTSQSNSEQYDNYGYTETYFFNGLDTENLDEFTPEKRTNAPSYYGLLTGMPYQTKVKNYLNEIISVTRDYWYVNTVTSNKENAYYPTKVKTFAYSEGIYDSTIYVYNTRNGMVQKTIHRCDVLIDAGKRDFISEVKYAHEQNEAMEAKNMLAQVYETKTFEAVGEVAQGAAISDAITEYDQTTGLPTLSKIYDGSSWITTSQVTRDAAGNVTQTYNPIDGVYSSTVWGYGSKLPIAGVSNAQSSEVKVENCEFFSESEALVLGLKKIGTISIAKSSNVFSGQGQYFSGNAGTGIEYTIGMIPAQKSYIIEFDYYIEAGQLNIKLATTSAGETPLGTLNTVGTLKHVKYTSVLMSNMPYVLRFLSAVTGGKFVIDNIRIYPADAYCVSTIYDKNTYVKLASTDDNGITSTVEYDEYDTPVRQRNWKKQIVSEQNSYLSKSWNTAYNSADPNYSISASFPNGNYLKNWSFEEDHVSKVPANWSSAGQPTSIVTDGKFGRRAVKIVKDTTNSSLMQNMGKFEVGKTLTASAWFKASANVYGQIYIGDYNDAANGKIVSVNGNGAWQRISVTLTLTKTANMSVFIYGSRDYGTAGVYVIYDGIMVEEGSIASDPIVNIAYSNGIGQTIQTQSIENTQRHITAVEYDAMGRDYKKWRTYMASGSTGYDASYATACSTYYGSAKQYTEKKYSKDPLSRIYTVIPIEPMDDNEASKTYYGSNAAEFLKYVKTEGKIGPNESTVTSYTYYDKLGREVKSVVGDRTANTTYNKQGKVVQTTDPMNLSSYMTYDYLGRLKSKTTPDVGLTEYLYDKAGRLRAMLEPEGRKTNMYNVLYWKYDKLGRVIEKGYTQYVSTAWSTSVQNEINASSNWPATPTAWRKKYTFGDALASNAYGKLVKIQVNSDADTDAELEENFAYDESDQTISKTMKSVSYDSKTYFTNYAYDALGRTTKIYYPTSETVNPADIAVDNQTFASGTSSYNSYGMISSANTTINSGASITFTAGKNIRLKPGFKASSGSSFKAKIADALLYTYDQRGNTSSVGIPDDPDYYASYLYNSDGSMRQEALNTSSSTPIVTNYSYDAKGRLSSMVGPVFGEALTYNNNAYSADPAVNKGFYSLVASTRYKYFGESAPAEYYYKYDYDVYGRMISADNTLTPDAQPTAWDIGIGAGKATVYDKNDKIDAMYKGATALNYTYHSTFKNRLINTDGTATVNYEYDANGNLTRAVPRGLTTTYDIFTQMPMAQTVPGLTMNFEYDANNERTYMLSGTVKQLYLRGLGEYPLVTLENTSGVEKATQYIYGPTGLIYIKNSYGNYYINKDHIGSVRAIVNESSSAIAAYYDYSPYGELIRQGGSYNSQYKFTGQEFDSETGLFNFRARLYDPAIGMFYGVDPAGQGYSPYGYAGNNPVKFVDRDGRAFTLGSLIRPLFGNIANFAYTWVKTGNFSNALQAGIEGTMQDMSSSIITHGINSAIGSVSGGYWPNTGVGVVSGATSGAASAAWNGKNIGQGALWGGVSGGVMTSINYMMDPVQYMTEQEKVDFYLRKRFSDLHLMMAINDPPWYWPFDEGSIFSVSGDAWIARYWGYNIEGGIAIDLGKLFKNPIESFALYSRHGQTIGLGQGAGLEFGYTKSKDLVDFVGRIKEIQGEVQNPVEWGFGVGKFGINFVSQSREWPIGGAFSYGKGWGGGMNFANYNYASYGFNLWKYSLPKWFNINSYYPYLR